MAILRSSFKSQLDFLTMENQKINAYRVSLSDIVGVYENLSEGL